MSDNEKERALREAGRVEAISQLAAIGAHSFDIYSDEDGFEWRHFSRRANHTEGKSAESLSEYLKTIAGEVAA